MKEYTYDYLLSLLTEAPEFTFGEDNDCDSEIIAVGKALWKQWNEEDKLLPFDETGIPETLEDCGLDRTDNTVRRQVATLALVGDDSKTVAKKLGKSHSYISTVFYQLGFPQRNESSFPFTREQLIADMTEIGSLTKVGAKYGKSYNFIRNAMKTLNIDETQFTKKPAFVASTKELRTVYNQTASISKTAKHFGVGYEVIRKNLIAKGITTAGKRGSKIIATKEECVKQWESIGTLRGMAAHFKVSTTYMSKLLADYGIRERGGRGSGVKTAVTA